MSENRIIRFAFFALLLAFSLIPAISEGASFDCSRAVSWAERTICGNAELGRLDDEMGRAYKQAAAEMQDRTALTIDQGRWLRERRDKCHTAECLKREYGLRIGELRKWNDNAATDRDIFGNYRIERANFQYSATTGKNEPVKTTDCLSLSSNGSNGILFSFLLIGGNIHMCSMKGSAVFKGSYYEFQPGKDDDEGLPKDCRLRITVKRNTILLSDPGDKCREYSCGARAGIDGTEFSRRLRSNKACQTIE